MNPSYLEERQIIILCMALAMCKNSHKRKKLSYHWCNTQNYHNHTCFCQHLPTSTLLFPNPFAFKSRFNNVKLNTVMKSSLKKNAISLLGYLTLNILTCFIERHGSAVQHFVPTLEVWIIFWYYLIENYVYIMFL